MEEDVLADDRTPRGILWIRLAALSAAVAGGLAFARFVKLPSFPLCSFQNWTGHPCPGCGMTRSIVHLGKFQLVNSLRFPPLGVVFAGTLLIALAGTALALVSGKDPVARFLAHHGVLAAAGLVVALVGVWVARVWIFPDWSAVLH